MFGRCAAVGCQRGAAALSCAWSPSVHRFSVVRCASKSQVTWWRSLGLSVERVSHGGASGSKLRTGMAFNSKAHFSTASDATSSQQSPVTGDDLRALADKIVADPVFAQQLCDKPSAVAMLQDANAVEQELKERGDASPGFSGHQRLISRSPPPSFFQLRMYALHNFIPFVGFGFFDNAIMILAGDYIDGHIGLALGMSTMAAAAIGNTFSDVIGLWISGFIETAAVALGLPDHNLSNEQQGDIRVRILRNVAMICGIVLGCVLGMFPLAYPNEWRFWESRKQLEAALAVLADDEPAYMEN